MNGKDDRFSIGLSNGKEGVSKWIIPQSQITAVDIVSVDEIANAQIKVDEVTDIQIKVDEVSDTLVKVNGGENMTIYEAVSTEVINKSADQDNSTVETSSIGEKRKHKVEDTQIIIPNTFKRPKTDQGCKNGKIYILSR